MDYKKKYENALEWARHVINGECGFIRKDVEEVFPELKESEDEKVRKAIVELVLQSSEILGSNNQSRMLAWLEKQGEQKPNWCEGCNNAKGCVACVDGSEWAHIEKHNPAWSEEDEEQVSIITNIVQAHCGKLIDCRANLKWLESLKERLSL